MKIPIKTICGRLLLILGPGYGIAYLTDKMVYVVPTLAASLAVMAVLENSFGTQKSRVDEESSSGFEFDGN